MPTIFRDVVSIDGYRFNDVNPIYRPATARQYAIDVLDGWDNTPDPETFTTDLADNLDGSVSGSFWPVRARFVTIGGYVVATSRADAIAIYDSLIQAIPRNKVVRMIRETPVVGNRFLDVRRAAGFEVEWLDTAFRWQTTVRADDPLKYSEFATPYSGGAVAAVTGGFTFPLQFPLTFVGGTSTAGAIGAINRGSAPTRRFTIQITGPVPRGAWRLRNERNDGEIAFDTGLLTGDLLSIDFKAQTATLNGFPIASKLIGDFFVLEPGTNTIKLYTEYSVSIAVTVNVYSAWE